MYYYPTGPQAQIIDKYTQEEIGIPGLVLMEKAAETLASEIEKKINTCEGEDKLFGFRKDRDKILAVAEGGNNGGDAIAAARILKAKGYDTYIYEINGIKKQSESYIKQVSIAKNLGVKFISPDLSVEDVFDDFRIIIDGIFGVGLTRDVTGIQKEVVAKINLSASKNPGPFVIAVDIPSGICSTTGKVLGEAVKCDMTVTFQYIKYGMLLGAGRENSGEIICTDIGLYKPETPADFEKILTQYSIEKTVYIRCEYDGAEVLEKLPSRKADSNKGSYGKVLILAGSKDVYGALYLSAEACYRMGAGLVKVVTDIRNRDLLMEKLPEAMCLTYNSDNDDDENESFILKYKEVVDWADVILAGPGLGTSKMSRNLLYKLMDFCTEGHKIILDADALNIISQDDCESLFRNLSERIGIGNVVITPHIMEMVRLRESLGNGPSLEEEMSKKGYDNKTIFVKDNALELVQRFSDEFGIICILKDARTIIGGGSHLKQGYPVIYINTTGNNGMSTGGSGDVLSGITASILAQTRGVDKCKTYEAACIAVNLHGRAGDIVRDEKGERSLLAGDIISALSRVVSQ